MGHPVTNYGALFEYVRGSAPIALSAGAQNGDAINRTGMQSCKLIADIGAATGTPTTIAVDCKLQHSADGSTGWADYTDPDTGAVAAITQSTTGNEVKQVNVNLKGAYNYIRTVTTVAFTGGTTPAVPVAQGVALGGDNVEPAVAP
jgi:hypothetical protein